MNSGYIVLCKPKRLVILKDTRGNYSVAVKLTPKERNRQRAKAWKENNPDKYKQHLEYVRRWRKKNKEKARQYNLKWRNNHREQYNAQQREYHRNHIEQRRAYYHNRRKKLGNE